ncbi:MAG: sulfite exporter TauE/SafE family protein [Burkholderiaceae bacterium]|nr:sulfite exporter TauE/SafE family protein [Burkholderiaceae bacterium]
MTGPDMMSHVPLVLAGALSGGLASLSGPLATLWCGLKPWTPDEQRAVYQPFNFAILSAALAGFGLAGLLTPEFVRLVALSLPATLAGVWIGRRCYGRVDASLFRRIVLGMLAVSGLTLVAQSLLR